MHLDKYHNFYENEKTYTIRYDDISAGSDSKNKVIRIENKMDTEKTNRIADTLFNLSFYTEPKPAVLKYGPWFGGVIKNVSNSLLTSTVSHMKTDDENSENTKISTKPSTKEKIFSKGLISNEKSTIERQPEIFAASTTTPSGENRNPVSWKDFLKTSAVKIRRHWTVVYPKSLRRYTCESSIVSAMAAKLSNADLEWCHWALSAGGGGVQIGKSWGKLRGKDRIKYESTGCNAVAQGSNPSCNDVWGDSFISNWLNNRVDGASSGDMLCPASAPSKVHCFDSSKTNRVCAFENAMMNFKKMHKVIRPGQSSSRRFDKGFIAADCAGSGKTIVNFWEGYAPDLQATGDVCDVVIPEPVFVYSHDELRNLGHTMQDLMNVWLMFAIGGQMASTKDVSLLNVDAMRLYNNHDDRPSAFFRHHELRFKRILKAADFADKTVCFKRLLFQPRPVVGFVWDQWEVDVPCTFKGPSSLYQRWNLHTRMLFNSSLDKDSDGGHRPAVRVLLVIRQGVGGDGNEHKIRNFANQPEIEATLRAIPDVELVVQDLGKLQFEEQVRFIATMDVMVGMHGAGLSHLTHMPLGSPNCCGLIEIFPKSEWTPARGHGNMARKLGFHYKRIDFNSVHATNTGGSVVPVTELEIVARDMLKLIRTKPSCVLPDVLDDVFLERNVSSIWSGVHR